MNIADAYDANLLTAALVATEIFKILIREILAAIVFWICMIFGFSLLH